MTQQNAALVEQSAAAAESLKDQANRLAQTVATFKLGDGNVTHSMVHSVKAAAPAKTTAPKAAPTPAKAPTVAAAPAAPKASPAPAPVASAPAPAPAASGASDDWETF
jgi:methyl-accepting chemotaxis protein